MGVFLSDHKDSGGSIQRVSEVLRRSSTVASGKSPDMIDLELADFEVSKMLGKGAFGKVFKARTNQITGRKFAIKVVRKDKLVESKLTDNSLLELQIFIVNTHPNLL